MQITRSDPDESVYEQCPSKSCQSSKLTPAARKRLPKVCFKSCTLTCGNPAFCLAFRQPVDRILANGLRLISQKEFNFMQYFIYGNPIPMHTGGTTAGFQSWDYRHYIPANEIRDAYPQSDIVRLFKNEEDVLNYCNSLSKTECMFPSYLYPIYVVDSEEIDDKFWHQTEISFHIKEYTQREYPSNKNTHDEQTVNKKCILDIVEVPLSSLQPVSGMLKTYYDSPHDKRIKGSTDFQPSYSWPCAMF